MLGTRSMTSVILFSLLAVLAGPAYAKSQLVTNLESGKPQTVVAYGTSLTQAGAWVNQVEKALSEKYPGQLTVINSGGCGQWSKRGIEHLDTKVIANKPDTVFIEFAINDSVARFKGSPEIAKANLLNMIDRIREALPDCEIILMTMTPGNKHPEGHRSHRKDIADYYEMYRAVAQEKGLLLIDHYPNWIRLQQNEPERFQKYVPDTIHPTAEGNLQVVTPVILEALGIDSQSDLHVSEFAPGTDAVRFKFPTHIAFGPGDLQIVTDLKNSRFVFRKGEDESFQVSPLPLNQPHSVVYNPFDELYYANDTDHHRIIAFADLESASITAQTKQIAGVPLKRPHDIVLDPETGWLYAINPYSGQVFRFSAIGENETVLSVPAEGYARSLSFVNGRLYVIGSARGRVIEISNWDRGTFKIHDSFDPTGKKGPAGSWEHTGLVLNDLDYYSGYWYATSYFTAAYAAGTDPDPNKFIRFKTFDDLSRGDWTDLSERLPKGLTPYYLTVHEDQLYLAVFNHSNPGAGDSILRISENE